MVNVLLRALKTQGRLDVLSRPNVNCLDKQAAVVVAGENIPLNNGSNATATGVVSTAIIRQSVGVTLQVTPSITPDGRVLMRIIPEVTNVASTVFPISAGETGTSLGIQHLETTVNAEDGETVLLGGLISKSSNKNENKVPWLGDLPGVGSMFRYRTEQTTQTELIIIVTPHIVRNRQEGERALAEDARRISWNLQDVMRVHGNSNCSTFMPAPEPPCPGGPTQPYRIIPGQPNGYQSRIVPGPQPDGFQGFQAPPPIPVGPTSRFVPPMGQSGAIQNAGGMPNAQPAPAPNNAAPAGNGVPRTQAPAPSTAPLPLNLEGSVLPGIPNIPASASASIDVKGPAAIPGGPGGALPTRLPYVPPQDPQLQAPPTSAPWVLPGQTNYYDKK